MPVSGVTQAGGPNLNGIVAKSGVLLVGETSSGKLFRVNPDTGIAVEVDLGDVDLPGPDGLELRGNTLYVVGGGLVTVVRLGARLASSVAPSGVVLGVITDPGEPNNPLLDVPTTATVASGRLWVVNARFTTPPTPDTEYWITQLPLRPGKRLSCAGCQHQASPEVTAVRHDCHLSLSASLADAVTSDRAPQSVTDPWDRVEQRVTAWPTPQIRQLSAVIA